MALDVAKALKTYVQGFSSPVYLLNAGGTDLISGLQGPSVPDREPEGKEPFAEDGYLFYPSRVRPGLCWAAARETGHGGDFFLLLDGVLASLQSRERETGPAGAYRRLLTENLSHSETEALAAEYRLQLKCGKTVYLIRMTQDHGEPLDELLPQVLPLSPGDVLVPIDGKSAVFLREAPRQEGETESLEFAQAVQESILTEAGYSVIIGIGAKAKDLFALHAGYLQASRAISIGRIFCENQTVFDYASMLLPRFLSELSPDIAERYHHLLFNPSTSRLFNEEMLRTIEVFFQKDLNLSDTARQLYIHRNTLVYRLDKVQRETGLDLRKFEDALTFRMLLDMRKCKYYTDCTPD